MKKSFAYSKINLLQFILFLAILFAENTMMFVWLLLATTAFEMAGIFLLQCFKMRTIKEGDVVQLKSGGPKMVADSFESSMGWFCYWFDEAGQRQSMHFRVRMLNRA